MVGLLVLLEESVLRVVLKRAVGLVLEAELALVVAWEQMVGSGLLEELVLRVALEQFEPVHNLRQQKKAPIKAQTIM
jgi:hypothetical protein